MDEDVNATGGIQIRTVCESTDMGEYDIRHEEWNSGFDDLWTPMSQAYTKSGDYIGDADTAAYLTSMGIAPEKRTATSSVCSIGLDALTQTWYGWSHRALHGFAIGDTIKPEWDQMVHFPVTRGNVIHTLDEAKACAIAFAEYVS